MIEEPSLSDATQILKGLKSYYENFHNVRYSVEAIKSAVELSSRYIKDRRLPDAAIDVLDEAGATTNIFGNNSVTGTTILSGNVGIGVKTMTADSKLHIQTVDNILTTTNLI